MASLPPKNARIEADILERSARVDDIARLKTLVDLPTLQYVEVTSQIELTQALARWPLLAHVQQHRQEPRHKEPEA